MGRPATTIINSDLPRERHIMLKRSIFTVLALPALWACGGNIPEPKQPAVEAEAAARGAREVGADSQPAAKLHLRLADEQINEAKAEIAKGDNERATYLLVRARADAELALALAREQNAIAEVQKAQQLSASAGLGNGQGK
jgi:hypothetical protein